MNRGTKPARQTPATKRTTLLRARLLDAISESTLEAVLQKLVDEALEGKAPAMKLFFEYAAGRPSQSREVLMPERESDEFDMSLFFETLLSGLANHPDARIELAAALKTIDRDEPVPRDDEVP